MKKAGFVLMIWVIGIFFFTYTTSAQCAMCRATLDNNAQEPGMAEGLNMGIVYLMCTPYILVIIVALAWYRMNKKVNK